MLAHQARAACWRMFGGTVAASRCGVGQQVSSGGAVWRGQG